MGYGMWINSRLDRLNILAEAIRADLAGLTFKKEHSRRGAILKLHEEVSEIFRADRKGEFDLPCDKAETLAALGLPVLSCGEEEIADTLIVLLGFAHAERIDLARAVAVKMAYNTRPR